MEYTNDHLELTMANGGQNLPANESGKEEMDNVSEFSEEQKIRAAYALNLCTVSVSQIIDYEDENILEQEYEIILNNLNLENMPKDEALLSVLKQILDTVTFFRIQEGDKAFIEREYQYRLKNAIWSAVPNFGLIVGGFHPFTMLLSLASEIGIGFMNYRKFKAEITLDKEKQEWQLQRAAIEQLNALRRELFDTSWRLADRYGFKDEYRLTERQITQYDKILMDSDDDRRYERLDAIKDSFIAYPPFWYYFGHAANLISLKAFRTNDMDVYEKYRNLAKQHFDQYMTSNRYALLREDQITSSCALEYIDLLDANEDKDQIKGLLDLAIKMSGRSCDILQLCAVAYLRISEIASAVSILKYLVNEDYNTVTNAQLLSSIYVSRIVEGNDANAAVDYKILQTRISEELLFPVPKKGESVHDLMDEFVANQQNLHSEKYRYVINEYIDKCTVLFNQSLPVPKENKRYPDDFFSDQYEKRTERYKTYKSLFSNRHKAEDFVYRLANSNFALAYLNVLNLMVDGIETILPGDVNSRQNMIQSLALLIEHKIVDLSGSMIDLQEKMYTGFDDRDFTELFELSFESFTEEFFDKLEEMLKQHIVGTRDMAIFSVEENVLRSFCQKQNIPEFVILKKNALREYDEFTGAKIYFPNELLGEDAHELAELLALTRRMAQLLEEKKVKIFEDDQHVRLYTKWNREVSSDYEKALSRKKYYNNLTAPLRSKIFAIITSKGAGSRDLVFTTDGLIYSRRRRDTDRNPHPRRISYGKVIYQHEQIILGEEGYINKEVNQKELYDVIQELAEMAPLANRGERKRSRVLNPRTDRRVKVKVDDIIDEES